jgi:2-keto-4-pentenoate hydratase/2-oxohepta-3-ene-1,7-dioic acid hydratase in catechol pathway
MRLCTFRNEEGFPRLGVLWIDGTTIVDVARLAESKGTEATAFRSMRGLIEAGPEPLALLRIWLKDPCPEWAAPNQVDFTTLLAPIPDPPRLRCFSIYEKHLVQAFRQVLRRKLGGPAFTLLQAAGLVKAPKRFFEVPAYYKGNHCAIAGPGEEIPWPAYSDMIDYELELCVVIGRAGKDVPETAALNHVFGYTILNDFSARDALMSEVGFGPSAGPAKGKDFDRSNAIGPWILTADEVSNPRSFPMEVRVNGVLKGSARSGDGAHRIERLISYASRGETLVPGELLSCGAVGDGTGIERWEFLQPGDEVELTIGSIGSLVNRMGPKPHIRPLTQSLPEG